MIKVENKTCTEEAIFYVDARAVLAVLAAPEVPSECAPPCSLALHVILFRKLKAQEQETHARIKELTKVRCVGVLHLSVFSVYMCQRRTELLET